MKAQTKLRLSYAVFAIGFVIVIINAIVYIGGFLGFDSGINLTFGPILAALGLILIGKYRKVSKSNKS